MSKYSTSFLLGTVTVVAVAVGFYVLFSRQEKGDVSEKDESPETDSPLPLKTTISKHMSDEELIDLLEERVQRDEGKRGIAPLVHASGKGELYKASKMLLGDSIETVIIITGFPCMVEHTPPTETDGPLGAMAIALALIRLGKKVVVATDEVNEQVLLAAAAALGATGGAGGPHSVLSHLLLESFAGGEEFDGDEAARLESLVSTCDLAISIERPGPASDGTYRTMRGLDMSHMIAPLDRIFLGNIPTIAIGDGGNEVGMGRILQAVMNSGIPHAKNIACVTSCAALLVVSVSNWGGYALAAALSILQASREKDTDTGRRGPQAEDYLTSKINKLIPTDASKENLQVISIGEYRLKATSSIMISKTDEYNILAKMVAAGARDGVTGKEGLFVDGMALEESSKVLEELRLIASNP